jgi:hypothetical protein
LRHRRLAVVHDYDALVRGLIKRAEALNVSCETIDSISGLPQGYASKTLLLPPIKRFGFGAQALWLTLQSLGLALAIVEDTQALARVQSRLIPRKPGTRRRMQDRAGELPGAT